MRLTLLFASALLFAVLSGAGLAQPADSPQPSSSRGADEAWIRAAMEGSAAAWNRGDLKGHLSIYVEDVTFMTANGPRPGVAPLEESFAKKYFNEGRPKQSLSFERIAVRRLGPDAALATGRFVLSGGNEPEQSGWFSLVWMRTPQGWKVIHDHSS